VIALFAAMETEAAACPEWTRNGERTAVGDAVLIAGEGAFVCQTGIGRERALAAAETILATWEPAIAMSVGVAGGLAGGVSVGEVVICSHVDHESHRHSDTEQSVYADPSLLEKAIEVAHVTGIPARTGTCLTVEEAAWGPAEKAAHHSWKAHDIVEMESFWIAEAASRRGVPFLAVRSISDASGDTLPNTGSVRPDGSLDMDIILAHLKDHPETAERLSALAQSSKLALANLSAFLEAFLPALAVRETR
jgi:adenosylhomocysteine nucleosidase